MSDEAMESVPGLKPFQYTAKHYALYLDKMVERTEKLNKGEIMKGKVITSAAVHFCLVLPFLVGKKNNFLLSTVDPQQGWTPHRLELCLWAMTIAEKQQLPLLQDVDLKAGGVEERCSDSDTQPRPAKKLKTK